MPEIEYKSDWDILEVAHRAEEAAVERAADDRGYKGEDATVGDRMHGSGMFPGGPEMWASLRSEFEYISSAFEPFLKPDPKDFDSIIRTMDATITYMKEHESEMDISDLHSTIEDWTGDAAENFNKYIVKPMDEVVERQRSVPAALYYAMQANKDVFLAARSDVCGFGEKAIEVFEERADDTAGVLNILAAVATIAAGAATFYTGAGLAVAIVGVSTMAAGGFSLAANVAADTPDPGERTIDGDNAEDIAWSLIQALSDVSSKIDEKEQEIVNKLESLQSEMEGASRDKLLPRVPDSASKGVVDVTEIDEDTEDPLQDWEHLG